MLITIFESNKDIAYDELLTKIGPLKEANNMGDYFSDYKTTYY